MERALDDWCARAPMDPQPYIERVINRALLHDKTGAQEAEESFFLRFNSYLADLLKLSDALVPLGETNLSRQCIVQAEAQGFATFTLQQLLMETCLSKGDWTGAQEMLAQLDSQRPPNDTAANYWVFESRLISATLDPASGTQALLTSKIQEQRLSIVAYRRFIDVLRAAKRNDTALDIARIALDNYPNSESLKKTVAALATEVTTSEATKPHPVITPVKFDATTADKITATAREALAEVDDEALFSKHLAEQVKSGQIDEALSAILAARNARPAWLIAPRG